MINPLVEIISGEVKKHGAIPFSHFMELALYCPVYGYYEAEKDKVGRCGDFYTSVSVGSLFGELLAFRFSEWLESNGNKTAPVQIVEAGAHNGQLACDILNWVQRNRPGLFQRLEYRVIEPSVRRQQWQKETLQNFPNVRWLESFSQKIEVARCGGAPAAETSDVKVNGIIFSNELLDAMPVQRFGWDAKAKEWFEWGVAMDGTEFVWRRVRQPDGTKTSDIQHPKSKIQSVQSGAALDVRRSMFDVRCSEGLMGNPCSIFSLPSSLLQMLPDRYTIETSPAAENWWREATNALNRGKLLAIDYGFTADELFVPERTNGTLRAYFRHRVADNLLANPGEQDLTAHVNFTAIQKVGEATGLKTETLESQAKFLTETLEKITNSGKESWNWTPQRARQFQTLTHPDHLGRGFRVLVQSRKSDAIG